MKRCINCMIHMGDQFEVCPQCGYVQTEYEQEAVHMVPGTILNDRYIIGRVIGFGGFGVTYVGWDAKLEQKVAVKEYMPSEFSTRMPGYSQLTILNGDKGEQFRLGKEKFIDEARRLAKFQSESGIVKVFDSFEENNTAYIITEYLDGETLAQYLQNVGTIPEDMAIEMMLPLMNSLKTVHEAGILHRDIAPDNIFITKTGEFKLIDFGASRYSTTTHSRSLTVIVKPGYSPEEQYRSRGDQGPHTDVYSLAATLYKMITGKTPPDAMERRTMYETKNKDILVPPHKLKKKLSVITENALLNALNVRIEDRTPDVDTLIHELTGDKPAPRIYGKIKKIDLYHMPLWMKTSAVVVFISLAVVGVLIATGVIRIDSLFTEEIIIPDGIVQVADVEGLTQKEAASTLEEQGLLVYQGEPVHTEYVADGLVVSQDPLGGYYLPRGGEVLLVTAYGTVMEAENHISVVPNIYAMTLELGKERLEQAGLGKPQLEYITDEYVPEGNICGQSVDSGTQVAEGTVITVYVSAGSAAFDMPGVLGLKADEAIKQLEGLGLKVTTTKVSSDTVPIGCVASQSVDEKEQVKKGTAVSLGIVTEEPTIAVADVTGKTEKEAVAELKNAGFEVSVLYNYDMKVPAGGVISQTPEANTRQTKGAKVTLFISKGKQTVVVNFNGNGGKAAETKRTVNYGEAYGNLPSAERKGYDFKGWYTSNAGGDQINSSTVVSISTEHTLYAMWQGIPYTLTLDANGGSVSTTKKTVYAEDVLGKLPTPARDHYTFQGWFTDKKGGIAVTANTIMDGGDLTIYAHWSPVLYTLKLNANGGNCSSSMISVAYDSTYGSLPTPTKSHYSFQGWFTKASGGTQVSESTVMSGDTTVYAHWKVKSYTLSFNANGGNCSTGEIKVAYGEAYGDLPKATRPKYKFKGWFTAASGGTKVNSSTVMEGNTTVYAHWDLVTYTVSFNLNGGSGTAEALILSEGDAYGALPTPSRSHYSFQGWYTAADGGTQVNEKTTMGTSDLTLYAHWKIRTYTLSFDANGGSCGTGEMKIAYGEAYGDLPKATRPKYKFKGWFTAASGGTKVNSSTVMEGNATLYAHWDLVTYTVSFDMNGGKGSAESLVLSEGDSYGALPSPSRDYYRFVGWYTAAEGGSEVSSGTVMGTDSVTIYAHWKHNPESDWVRDSKVPDGAKITDNKWKYKQKNWITSSSPSADGYTLDESRTKRNEEWGPWSAESREVYYASDTRQVNVRTESVVASYNIGHDIYMTTSGYRHYYDHAISNQTSQGYTASYHWNRYETVSKSTLESYGTVASGGYASGIQYAGYNKSGGTGYLKDGMIWFVLSANYEDIYYYQYRDLNVSYTYYLYSLESKESTSEVSVGGDITEVTHYVKYREK